MKIICSFFLLLLIIGQAFSQEEEIFRHPLTAQTTESFRAVCARIAQYPVIRGNFEQEKILSRINRSLKSSGSFLIASDKGMVWDTLNPFPSTLVLGKDFLIQSRPGGQRTVLSAQGNEIFVSMAEILSAVFSGNAQSLEKNFFIYFKSSSSSWELGLKPLNTAINAFAERIIMSGDTVIKTIVLIENGGDSTKYILLNHNFPGALNANEQALFVLP